MSRAARLGEQHRVREQLADLDAARNGVAASSVSSISSALWILLPLMCSGLDAGAGQYRQGALNQALAQVSNGAIRLTLRFSRLHLAQLSGHWTSVHSTAL